MLDVIWGASGVCKSAGFCCGFVPSAGGGGNGLLLSRYGALRSLLRRPLNIGLTRCLLCRPQNRRRGAVVSSGASYCRAIIARGERLHTLFVVPGKSHF